MLHAGFIVLSLHFRCYDVARETFEFYGNPSNSDSELERERMDEKGSMTMIWSDECVCWKSPCPACLGHIHMHESHEQMVSTSNPTGRPQHKAWEPGKPLKINLFVGLRNIHISSFIIENQWNSCQYDMISTSMSKDLCRDESLTDHWLICQRGDDYLVGLSMFSDVRMSWKPDVLEARPPLAKTHWLMCWYFRWLTGK